MKTGKPQENPEQWLSPKTAAGSKANSCVTNLFTSEGHVFHLIIQSDKEKPYLLLLNGRCKFSFWCLDKDRLDPPYKKERNDYT